MVVSTDCSLSEVEGNGQQRGKRNLWPYTVYVSIELIYQTKRSGSDMVTNFRSPVE